ncbi:MAG: M28 family peptidase [Pseudomonadota bacterium]
MRAPFAVATAAIGLVACSQTTEPTGGYVPELFDGARVLTLVETLSDDAFAGRAAGTPGNAAARAILLAEMERIGLAPVNGTFEHPFTYGDMDDGGPVKPGVNLIGRIDGSDETGRAIIITAHFDHLGEIDGEIYNGADDNASGVGAILAIAAFFTQRPPENDIYIVLLDAEEEGLGGAIDFMANPPLPAEEIAFNLNLDMVSKSEVGELYAVGTYHTPAMVPFIEEMAEVVPVTLLMGHDRPEDGDQDWTLLSDHAVFHRAGIPFLYLGVEDHPEYHQPSDVFDTIPIDFYLAATETAIMLANQIDERLATLAPPPQAAPQTEPQPQPTESEPAQ